MDRTCAGLFQQFDAAEVEFYIERRREALHATLDAIDNPALPPATWGERISLLGMAQEEVEAIRELQSQLAFRWN